MKTIQPPRARALLLAILFPVLFAGCAHKLPKDAWLKGVKSTVNTPWGPSTLDIAEAATGKAAANRTQQIPDAPAK